MAKGTALVQGSNASSKAREVVIGIATTGRAGILQQTLDHLASLADGPDGILVCIADESDFNACDLSAFPCPLRVLTAPKGLCNQRNTILDAVSDTTVVLFLDDDFLVSEGYISTLRRTFARIQRLP